jgi:hypothetical protein
MRRNAGESAERKSGQKVRYGKPKRQLTRVNDLTEIGQKAFTTEDTESTEQTANQVWLLS